MPRLRSCVGVAALGLALAACSDGPTGPATGSNTPDISALLAEMTPSTLGTATAMASPVAGLVALNAPAFDPANCTYTAETGFFVCPTVTRNGMTFTRMYRLIDAAGNSQSQPSAQTSAVETKLTMKGTPTAPAGFSTNGTVSIDGSSDMTLSGIRTDKHTLNGTSTTTMTGSFDLNGTSLPINTTMTETTTNLVLPNTKAGQQWPQSGSITVDETTDAFSDGSNAPETSRLVMTFNGTSIVTVTITDRYGTTTCHFDMANPGLAGGACS